MWELIIPAILIFWGVIAYNGLVRLRQQVDAAWADVDVQLKRRHNLVPNLVETVKGYAGHEKETLESVVQARSAAMSAQGPGAQAQAEGMLAGALKSLFALSEAYPQLRASENFQQLQGALAELEETIANSRRYYNAVVRDYNTRTETVPNVLVARPFGFKAREYFEVEGEARNVPEVDFGSGPEA
jgi:LemA protein